MFKIKLSKLSLNVDYGIGQHLNTFFKEWFKIFVL